MSAANDYDVREQVRRDAIAAGFDLQLAGRIAREVSTEPDKLRAVTPLMRLCSLFNARPLALDLAHAGLSLPRAQALLTEVAGTDGTIPAARIEHVRIRLLTGDIR